MDDVSCAVRVVPSVPTDESLSRGLAAWSGLHAGTDQWLTSPWSTICQRHHLSFLLLVAATHGLTLHHPLWPAAHWSSWKLFSSLVTATDVRGHNGFGVPM